MCQLMVVLTFLAVGEASDEFLPPIEKITFRIEVDKGGHWRVENEVRCKVPLDKRAAHRDLFDAFTQGFMEDAISDLYIDLHGKLMYPDDDHAVLTVYGEDDDPVMLVMWCRTLLGFDTCTFSWSGDEFRIAGKHLHSGPGIGGAVLAMMEPSLEPLLTGKVPMEIIVSSAGTIRSTGMPAKVDEDGHRMVVPMNDFDPSPDELWSFAVEGLAEK